MTYTKHYYIGSERIASVLGTKRGMGAYCATERAAVRDELNDKVTAAGQAVEAVFNHFGKNIQLPPPFVYSDTHAYPCSNTQVPEDYGAYWYHPDHLGSSSYITNQSGEISQHMEYLPFGETLVEEHLNSNNSPYKFNAKEFDSETGNYYYGARYYSPKYNLMLSVDPLYEMFPGISPYAYVLNNPIRYTDPTGMAAEENDCGIGCGLRKIFNTILYPNRSQLPDGKIERSGTKGGTSRATGWKFPKKKEKSNNESQKKSEKRTPTTIVSQLNLNDIVSQSFIPQANVQLPNLNPINNSIKVDDREIDIGYEPQSVNFQFAQIGSVASQSTDGVRTGTNRILPLTNTQQQNLQAIANYLVEKPQATVRLQYPTPLNSSHVNFNADIRAVYNMSFQQITNFLIQQGVTDPNRRILMSYGTGFDIIVNPGK